ncbi:MAG TPA: flagellar basal body P-ring formation chaperone FlgA [Candidimonas sp.]|nr:flagellar basal body P-ring formation chaperone FlgA [Candidimonas sp.]
MFKFLAAAALFSCSFLMLSPAYAQGAPTPQPQAQVQDPAAVAATVEEFLVAQASSYPGSARVTVGAPRITKQAACEDLQPFLTSGQRLRSRMTVGVRCVAPQAWTTYVQADLSIQGYFYVSNREIQVGDTVSLSDLTGREGDVLRLSRGVIFDPSQAIGYIATQRISAGATVKSGALRDPNSVQRGQTVRTEVRGIGFVATGEGQAMQGGSPGTQIQVKTSSGQIVTGTVLDATTVQVL